MSETVIGERKYAHIYYIW